MKAILLLASAISIAGAGDTTLTREGAYWVETVSGKLPLGPGSQIRVAAPGPVCVKGAAVDETSYVVRKRVRARTEAEARRLLTSIEIGAFQTLLQVAHPEWRGLSTEIAIICPRSVRLALVETQGGDVQIEGIVGNAQAASGGGLIRMDMIGGSASARTGGGEIQLGRIGGSVRCFSGGGSIQIEQCGSESWLETAGGEIRLRDAQGRVHASTDGGNIWVGRAGSSVFARTAGGRIEVQEAQGIVVANGGAIKLRGSPVSLHHGILADLSAHTGDITVVIPSNLALTVRARSEDGRKARIVSDFPEMLAKGELNGGGPLLNVSTAGGTIYFRRHK